jgi:3-methyl-2-oxobutanoate hydroxymethyltransferase
MSEQSDHPTPSDRLASLRTAKPAGRKLAVLTAYDFPTGRLLDEAGVDLILVGDSLGMVVLGYPDTTLVTLDDMVHHTRAVARGVQRAAIIGDLPYATYETPEQAVVSSRRLIEAGAHAVKLEGGVACAEQIRAIVHSGIPVIGHIGMLPQHVREEGGYKIKGKTPEGVELLRADARAVEEAGAIGVIMELVKPEVSQELTAMLSIPTIGIGAGEGCDGQVLVTHDLIGLFPWFTPKFAKPIAQVGEAIRAAAAEFTRRVHGY